MKMRFEEFIQEVVNKIREFLPESFANASVELQTVTKNNDLKLTGLTIRSGDSNIYPTIYLEQYYVKYRDGEAMESILSDIADVRIRHEVVDSFDTEMVMSFEKAKDMIFPRLIGADWNESLLKDRPHKVIADLAVTYHIMLNQAVGGFASVPITYDLMKNWGADVDALHDLAIHNMPILLPTKFEPMSKVLKEMMYSDFDEGEVDELLFEITPQDDYMYVLSNAQRINGAAALLDERVMNAIVEKLGGDFYILPSSIHECIIVPAALCDDIEFLTNMIQEVNYAQVSLDDRLSDHPYRYSMLEGIVSV